MKKNISLKVYKNIIIAIAVMIYFIGINTMYYKLDNGQLLFFLKIISMLILFVGIVILEIAFRKDNGSIGIHGIEIIILAGHTLSTAHMVELQKIEFANYILLSSYIFSIYYLFKALCIYTKERRDYLKSLSDIKEIVANDPIKKDATKKEEKI